MKRLLSIFLALLICGVVEACIISAGPTSQPVINSYGIGSCAISWTSDCIGHGDVRYGTSTSSITNYADNTQYDYSHAVTVQRLPSNIIIYYIVETTNRIGTVIAQSDVNSFTTLSLSPTPTPTVANTPTETPTDTPADTPTDTPTPTPTP